MESSFNEEVWAVVQNHESIGKETTVAILFRLVASEIGRRGGRPRKPVTTIAEPVTPVFAAPRKSLDLLPDPEEKDPESDSAELGRGSPVLEFPTAGKTKTWTLYAAHLATFREAYPGLDVEAEFRRAQLWCVNNQAKRKTPRGMGKFLQNWLDRVQNRGGGVAKPAAPSLYPRLG